MSIALTLLLVLCVSGVAAAPSMFGDLDNDGEASAADLVLMVNHNDPGAPSLPIDLIPFADADRSGSIGEGDEDWIVQALLGQVGLYGVNQTVQFDTPSSVVSEDDGTVSVVIDLSGYYPGGLVNYAVTGGSATEGDDYASLVGAVAVDIDEAIIPITIFEDDDREGVETIELTITSLANFETVLPLRHIVHIQDTERLWRGNLNAEASTYTDVISVDLVIVNDQGGVRGVIVGETTPTVPDGFWPTSVTFDDNTFTSTTRNLPVSVGPAFFGVPMERTLSLSGSTTNSSNLVGTFTDSYTSAEAPHLSREQTGQFRLTLVPDALPATDPELVTP